MLYTKNNHIGSKNISKVISRNICHTSGATKPYNELKIKEIIGSNKVKTRTLHVSDKNSFPSWTQNCRKYIYQLSNILRNKEMPTHSINNVVSLLYLYSLLNPYEKIISGNCSETILAQSFINSNALLSLGFMNSCISENLINT